MPDEILSQEEIDALLSAMDQGDVDLKDDGGYPADIVPCDMTALHPPPADRFDAMDEVYDAFQTLCRQSLESRLRLPVDVQLSSKNIVPYADFIKPHPRPTGFIPFSMSPLTGTALLVLEADLFFVILDIMAGGSGRPLGAVHDFTKIERGILHRVSSELLKRLEQAWQAVYAVSIAIRKTETNPDFLRFASAGDRMVAAGFEVVLADAPRRLHLCFPVLMLDPVKNELSSNHLQAKSLKTAFAGRMRALLNDTAVTLTAELGQSRQRVRDILRLKKDDVIILDRSPHDPVTVSVEGVPKFFGTAGVTKGNRAVNIDEIIRQAGKH